MISVQLKRGRLQSQGAQGEQNEERWYENVEILGRERVYNGSTINHKGYGGRELGCEEPPPLMVPKKISPKVSLIARMTTIDCTDDYY